MSAAVCVCSNSQLRLLLFPELNPPYRYCLSCKILNRYPSVGALYRDFYRPEDVEKTLPLREILKFREALANLINPPAVMEPVRLAPAKKLIIQNVPGIRSHISKYCALYCHRGHYRRADNTRIRIRPGSQALICKDCDRLCKKAWNEKQRSRNNQ